MKGFWYEIAISRKKERVPRNVGLKITDNQSVDSKLTSSSENVINDYIGSDEVFLPFEKQPLIADDFSRSIYHEETRYGTETAAE